MEYITVAGNTEVPAYLALRDLGFTITAEKSEEGELWIATKGDLTFSAPSSLQLLGLITLRKERGRNWLAPDPEIDLFLKRFYPSK
jgi:hypothetical protein